MDISYTNIDVRFLPSNRLSLKRWFKTLATQWDYELGTIAFGFCSDDYILKANKKYLDHDYYTDIITFDYSEGKLLNGDLLISIDTVRSNSIKYNIPFSEELHRVMIHGILHLMGFNDTTDSEKVIMRQKEDESLNILAEIFRAEREGA